MNPSFTSSPRNHRLLATTFLATLVTLPAFADGPRQTIEVPASIPADLSVDATDAINTFIKNAPDNSTLVFPKGAKYKIEGTLLVENHSGLTLEGNGALFKSNDSLPNYSKRNGAKEYTLWRRVRNRAHWRIKNSQDTTLKNLEVYGPHLDANPEGVFDAGREAQHAIDVSGAKGLTISEVHLHDLWGDGIYISDKSERVVIRDSKIQSTGRQGIAIAVATDILIENNDIGTSRRGLIDIEPFGANWSSGDIRIIGNRFGSSRLLALPMGGQGNIGLTLVANNTFTGANGVPLVYNRSDNAKAVRGPFVFVNNLANISGSSTVPLDLSSINGIFIAGNRLLFPANRRMTAVRLNKTEACIFGNSFAAAGQVWSSEETAPAGVRSVESKASVSYNALPEWQPKSKDLVQRITEAEVQLKAAPTQIQTIPGGYAIETRLGADTKAITVIRSGGDITKPRKLSGFGLETEAPMAWITIEKGKVKDAFVTDNAPYTYTP